MRSVQRCEGKQTIMNMTSKDLTTGVQPARFSLAVEAVGALR